MKRKKTELICEVATLRKERDREKYYRQMLESKIRNRNDKIVELQDEKKELEDAIRFKDDYIAYLKRVISKDVETMAKYVSFYEKVLELSENLEDDLDDLVVSRDVDSDALKDHCINFDADNAEIPNCAHFHVIDLSKEDLEDVSIGDIIERILEIVGEENE